MPDESTAERLGVPSTPYVREFYRAIASLRNAKSSFSSAVESSVSRPSPVPTTFSATSFLRSIISSIRSSNVPTHAGA